IPVKTICLEEPSKLKGDAFINYEILKKNSEIESSDDSAIEFVDFSILKKNISRKAKILIIDALIGTGIKGKLDETYTHAIVFLNELKNKLPKLKVISLDVPSGLMSSEQINPVINADMTITMGSVKSELLFGIGKENCGKLKTVPIGINKTLLQKYTKNHQYIPELNNIKELFPRRRKTSHKYSNGKLLVIGGSKGLSGAVAMSSLSAIKAGAGAVAVAVPKSLIPIFNRKFFEVMTVDLDETDEGTINSDALSKIKKRMEWADTVLLGPGISTNEKTKEFVFNLIQNCFKNMVIDADALNILSNDISVLKKKKFANEIILTPHLGEFSSLSGIDIKEIELNRFDIVRKFVKEFTVNLVLKAETTISCLKNGAIYINLSGNESLAAAGSGDVLSGIIASLLSQTN
ncbi:MAG: NAD(P)H-hydrate dehydratase, partial [Ignavibacteria bacterium]